VKKHVDFKKVRTVGVLFLLEDEPKFKQLDHLAKKLESQGKDVKMIGLFEGKVIPNFFIQKLKIDLFTKKDLNLFDFPKGEKVSEFIDCPFDLLLDFTENDILPMDYILGLSRAGFKAGRFRNDMVKVLDLMIKKPDDMDFDAFINSMIGYISIFNTKPA
jgi:hypothetical protein